MADEKRVQLRAEDQLPEEAVEDQDVRTEMAKAVLHDSDLRQADRNAAPDSFVEHRTSREATPPTP